MDHAINPYAPPTEASAGAGQDGFSPGWIDIPITKKNQRYAEKHYLLKSHSVVLTLLSVAAAFGGTASNIWLQSKGVMPFWIGQILLAALAAVAYLGIIYRAKSITRRKQRVLGMQPGVHCQLKIDAEQYRVFLRAPNESHDWPLRDTILCSTLRGLIICPEPHLFVFLPKGTDFVSFDAKTFRKTLTSLIQQHQRLRKENT